MQKAIQTSYFRYISAPAFAVFFKRLSSATLTLLVASLAMGCAYTNEITKTKQDIENYSDVDAETGIVVSLGPGLFHTAGFLAKFVDDEDAQMASRMAYGIRRIKAGVYPLDYSSNLHSLDVPEMRRFRKKGWKTALKVEAEDEVGWIMYRERRQRVRDLFVVVLTDEELVLARIQGNLTELLDTALDEIENEGGSDFFDDWGDW